VEVEVVMWLGSGELAHLKVLVRFLGFWIFLFV
jgi:hypothetical protein